VPRWQILMVHSGAETHLGTETAVSLCSRASSSCSSNWSHGR